MEEVFRIIEDKIKASGYPREISGEKVYLDISNQIDGKENGAYVLLSKFEDDVTFEYRLNVLDEDFDLSTILIQTPEGQYLVNLDE